MTNTYRKDVREHGSGNVGATNAGRLLGLKYGFSGTFRCLKGYSGRKYSKSLSPELARYYLLIAASFVIIGHNWSVFLRFMGGKGVATTCGVIFTLFPLGFIIFFIIWLIVLLLSRYVSLASIISGACLPLIIYFLKGDIYDLIFALIFALLIILRHRTNIIRLLNKTEDKIRWPLINRKGDL